MKRNVAVEYKSVSLTRAPFAAFTTIALLAAVLLIAGCGGAGQSDAEVVADTTAEATAPSGVVASGLATPESVLWDSTRSIWYISNINGEAKDDNGYILRVGPDGQAVDSVPFINGADEDITLNSPKGMALVGDTLWVADMDMVRGFNVTTGTAVASVDLSPMQATFLNDVVAGPDGTIYITDSGIAFTATGVVHSGKSRVFALNGRTATEAVVLPQESAANGIAWDPRRQTFVIVAYNAPQIFSWKPGTDSAEVIGTGPGGADGLLILADGRALYTSWADSSLNVFADGKSTTLRKALPDPADLGYDAVRGIVAVPLFSTNRVEFWPVR